MLEYTNHSPVPDVFDILAGYELHVIVCDSTVLRDRIILGQTILTGNAVCVCDGGFEGDNTPEVNRRLRIAK